MDKYYDVLAESSAVFVRTSAIRRWLRRPPRSSARRRCMNVLFGERYKMFPKESKGLLRGEYGQLPGSGERGSPQEVRSATTKVITCRPADLLKPELDKYREEIRDHGHQCEEDVLSYALFPKVAPKFFEYRSAHQTKIDSTMLNKDNKTMPV